MLTSVQRQKIMDRFRVDAEAVLDGGAITTPAGRQATVGDLWSQVMDGRKRTVTCPITAPTAAQTVVTRIMAVGRYETITRIGVVWGTVPSSALGGVLAVVNKLNGITVTAMSEVDIDVELHTADQENVLALAAVAGRRLIPGDVVSISITADNADANAGLDGVMTIELEPTEV